MAEVRELYERTCSSPDGFRLGTLLEQMQVDLQLPSADLERIPAKGRSWRWRIIRSECSMAQPWERSCRAFGPTCG